MFTTGLFVPSLLGILTLGDWMETGGLPKTIEENGAAGRGKKRKKSSSSSNNNNFFFVLCQKRTPTFYETILNKTEVDYYEKNHLLHLKRRTLYVKYCYCSIYSFKVSSLSTLSIIGNIPIQTDLPILLLVSLTLMFRIN